MSEKETSERDLSLAIMDYLNKSSLDFNFKFINSFCDIADEKHRVYVEVKPDHFAPAQLLHAIAKEGIKDAKYLGVANNQFVKLYSAPSFEKIMAFAMSFTPTLTYSPSQSDKKDLNEKAEKLLGEPERIIKLEFSKEHFFINKNNLDRVRETTDRYRINLSLLVNWLAGVGEEDCIKVNPNGWLVNTNTLDTFTNEHTYEKTATQMSEFKDSSRRPKDRKPKYTAIKPFDAHWFESLRVKQEDISDIFHEVDRLLPRKQRREHGVFWTEKEIGARVSDEILKLTKPDYVVEPCVGGGSLIETLLQVDNHIKGAMNDVDKGHVENCKTTIFSGYEHNWKFTAFDVVDTETDTLIKKWDVPTGKKLLLYTNPPFGSASGNRLVSKKGEMNGKVSRSQIIVYPKGFEKYGKGDLFIPIVGRLIEIAKSHKNCCLAFFSPFGLFCGRERYSKLLTILLKDFQFLKGYVFVGNYFHDVAKIKPIALTIWKYAPNTNVKHLDMRFEFVDKSGGSKNIRFKKMCLLKDGWNYDRRDKGILKGEVVVQHCETFNTPAPKIFHLNPKQGGSELIHENVKKSFRIPNVPDELVYGLWSVTVGARALVPHPIYFDNAYVHLPDFSKKEALEILVYSALHVLLKNYAEEKIGFFGTNKIFRFGNEKLTNGVECLFDSCKDCLVYDGHTISEVFELIKQRKIDAAKCRKGLKDEVSKRLIQIGYWDYIPIPKTVSSRFAIKKQPAKLLTDTVLG